MKQQDNKVIVGARLLEGNEVKVSTSVNFFKEFTDKNREDLLKQIKQKIEPLKEDVIYYSFKLLYKDKHDNKKFNSLDELLGAVAKIGT